MIWKKITDQKPGRNREIDLSGVTEISHEGNTLQRMPDDLRY